jgi:hypothetical protein
MSLRMQKMVLKVFVGFSRPTGGKTRVSLWKANGLFNVATAITALACDQSVTSVRCVTCEPRSTNDVIIELSKVECKNTIRTSSLKQTIHTDITDE